MVGHLLLYQPAIQWIKMFIQSGKLGQIYSISQVRRNLGRIRSVENALWSLGVHDIAVQLYLTNEYPNAISAAGQCAIQKCIEDDVHMDTTYPSGIQGHLHASWLWPYKERQLVVVAANGMLVFNELTQVVTLHHTKVTEDLTIINEGCEEVFCEKGEPLRLELQHFIDCVINRRKPISDGRSGATVVALLENASNIAIDAF
jgi:predicted dehydrogenase